MYTVEFYLITINLILNNILLALLHVQLQISDVDNTTSQSTNTNINTFKS